MDKIIEGVIDSIEEATPGGELYTISGTRVWARQELTAETASVTNAGPHLEVGGVYQPGDRVRFVVGAQGRAELAVEDDVPDWMTDDTYFAIRSHYREA